ncbi:hypothetical protein [Dyella sp. GSA-30]|uniref:hypothetical protein n=1 Tax=Dyella sp. GSA-30 TaxID=2994496 RepID=UPI0024906C53|nr:hypothetical protein [Dyella sp. GSA-30]
MTLALPGEAIKRGLVTQEIIGQLFDMNRAGGPFDPDNFARNRAFVDFMHGVIQKHGPAVPNLVTAAKAQVNGWVHIIDGRTPTPQGQVPAEDVIGAFQVKQGEIVPGSYRANPNHRILSHHGFFQLEPMLQQRLLDELTVYI